MRDEGHLTSRSGHTNSFECEAAPRRGDNRQEGQVAVLERLKRQMALDGTALKESDRQEAGDLERRLSQLTQITADLYEDKVAGRISESTFLTLMEKNEQERQRRQIRLDELRIRLDADDAKLLGIRQWAALVQRHLYLDTLAREDLDALVERIEVGESDYSQSVRRQEVRIIWQFVGAVDSLR